MCGIAVLDESYAVDYELKGDGFLGQDDWVRYQKLSQLRLGLSFSLGTFSVLLLLAIRLGTCCSWFG